MAVRSVAELGSGGRRPSRAQEVPLSAPPFSYVAAVDRYLRYLARVGIAKSSVKGCRFSLATWGWMLAGEPVPTGLARRGAKPPVFLIAAIDDPALPKALAARVDARSAEMGVQIISHELSVVRDAIRWWQRQGWITCDPTIGIECPRTPPGLNSAPTEHLIAAPQGLGAGHREGADAIPPQATGSVSSTRPTSRLMRLADLCELALRPIEWHELLQLSEEQLLAIHRGLRALVGVATVSRDGGAVS